MIEEEKNNLNSFLRKAKGLDKIDERGKIEIAHEGGRNGGSFH